MLSLVLTLVAQGPSSSTPVEPIGAILNAFRSHSIVALPNSHGNEQVHAFDLALIRDPRTADIVDDIVVEFGAPSLSILRGTQLGGLDFTSYIPVTMTRFTLQEGKPVTVPRDKWAARRMEDQFDALLYLGAPSAMTTTRLAAARCGDKDYMTMRLKRLTLVSGSQGEADRLKQYCASVVPK